jgi:branched-chain amino acid transport system substrate-binding protein
MTRPGTTFRAAPGRSGRRGLIPLLAVTLLMAAACGSDDSGDSDDSGSASGSGDGGAELAGSPIVVGMVADVTGPTGVPDAKGSKVFKVWADYTNDNGGIQGHPVEVRVADTRGDAPTAAAAAQDLLDDTSVVAVVSLQNTTEAATGEIFGGGDLAVIGGLGYNPTIWHALPNWYGITTSFPSVVNEQVAAAADVGAKHPAAVVCAEVPSCRQAEPVFQAAAKAKGLDYAGSVQVAASAPNYTAECLELSDREADFIQLSLTSGVSERLANDCLRQGFDGWFGASAASVMPDLYARVDGIRLAGGVNAFPWWIDSEPVQTYRDAMEEYGVADEDYQLPNGSAAWATGELFKKALSGIAEGDTVTRQTVQDAYGAINGETLDGLLPQPVTYTAGQPAPPVSCYWLYSYEDGEFTGGEEPTCDEAAS